jgi:hypothetical protein
MESEKMNSRYPNYLISADGRVWSCKRKQWLKPSVMPNGYAKVNLSHNGVVETLLVHRLVAELFCKGHGQVNHKDGNKLNNHYSNLEWVTAKENMRHALATGLRQQTPSGDACWNTQFPSKVRREVVELRKQGLLQRDIATLTRMSQGNVSRILKASATGVTV